MKQSERLYLGQTALIPGVAVKHTTDFPLGPIFHKMNLRIAGDIVVTGSNATWAAYANPILELINSIVLRTDVDGDIVNAPAKALYLAAANKYGTLPRISSGSFNPQTAGTYPVSVNIPLLFSDERMARPEDTVIFSGRYSRMELLCTLGAALDVIKTAGATSTFALANFTMSVELHKQAFREDLLPAFLPRFIVEEGYKVSTSGTIVNIGRSQDKAVKRVHIFTTSCGATVPATRNAMGDGSNAVVTTLTVKDENKNYLNGIGDEQMLDDQKVSRGWDENQPAGHYIYDATLSGLPSDAVSTGDKGTLQVEYIADGAAPAGQNIVTVCTESLISLK